MLMLELIERLEQSSADNSIKTLAFFIGSVAEVAEGSIDFYGQLKTIRIFGKNPIDIIVQYNDIQEIKYDAKNNNQIMCLQLNSNASERIHKYLCLFGHDMKGKKKEVEATLEIQLKDVSESQQKYLEEFKSKFGQQAFNGDNGNKQNDIGTRLTRKKKALYSSNDVDYESSEPVLKKPRKKQSLKNITDVQIETENAFPKRTLRNRRAKDIIVVEDDVNEKEEREVAEAIKRSLNSENISHVKKETTKSKAKFDPYEHIDKTIELFRYPYIHGFDNEIVVKMEDFLCLGKAEYLSDVIIDFYFSFIYNEKFTEEMKRNVYIFPSQFYSIYSTSSDYPGWKSEENAGKTALQKRYERIEGMLDKDINIFDKEFLVFPLFQNNHWFLSIVCFPKLTQNLLYDTDTPTDDDKKRNIRKIDDPSYNAPALKTSCILTFDSIKSNSSRRCTAMIHIRGFLKSHWERHYKDEFEIGNLVANSAHTPLQSNNVDCGCFIIEFFERFFITDPIRDFRLPIFKRKWFKPEDVHLGKRREIVDVITQKMQEYAIIREIEHTELPELTFHSEQLDDSIVEIEDEETGNNNNNDEAFNNNNDFNCLDSNPILPVSSIEPEQNSPEIFSDEQTASQKFDDLLRKDSDDDAEMKENEVQKLDTELIPIVLTADVVMKEAEDSKPIEIKEEMPQDNQDMETKIIDSKDPETTTENEESILKTSESAEKLATTEKPDEAL